MWCTQCHKAFSWNTGKIVTGPVHNPHFFQYQREHGGLARNPADVVCGGLPIYYNINQKIATAQLPKSHHEFFYDTVTRIYRLQTHFTDTYVNAIRRNIPDEPVYERLRIRYILNKIDREEMAHKISRWDGDRRLNAGILHVCELFTTVGADMFRRILLSEKKGEEFAAELKAQVAEYDTLRLYVNEQLKEISMTYGLCIQQIKPDWTNDTSKFNAKGETDQYIIKREQKREAQKEQMEAERQANLARLARLARQAAAEAGAAIA